MRSVEDALECLEKLFGILGELGTSSKTNEYYKKDLLCVYDAFANMTTELARRRKRLTATANTASVLKSSRELSI